MDTLLTIQNRLSTIAKNANISGPAVDGLVSLLSESIYRGQVGNVTELLEGSFSRCRLLNSAITHAADRGHSVFRGNNQSFLLKGVMAIEDFDVRKFDIALEVNGYYLVYDKDYSFKSGVVRNDIRLILCTDVKERSTTITVGQSQIRINFLFDNISDDIDVFLLEAGDPVRHSYSRLFNDAVRGIPYLKNEATSAKDYPYWVCTRENFGVSIINMAPDSSFTVNSTVTIKYLEYLEDQIDRSIITSIPGFVVKSIEETNTGREVEITYEFTSDNVESIPLVKRDESVSKIYRDAIATYSTNGMLRSYNDIANLVSQRYGSLITSINVRFDFTSDEDNPKILISYSDRGSNEDAFYNYINGRGLIDKESLITKSDGNSSGEEEVVAFSIIDFQNELDNSYFIQEKVYFVKPYYYNYPLVSDIKESLPRVYSNWNEWEENKIKIKVYFDNSISPGEEVKNIVNEFKETFQAKVNFSRLISKIQEVEGVKFAEIFVNKLENGEVVEEVEFPSLTLDLRKYKINKECNIPQRRLLATNFEIEEYDFSEYLNQM